MIASLPYIAYTVRWNVSGHPGLSVPVGRGRDGLPNSVQLVASFDRSRGEELLCELGEQLMEEDS